jgi:hypothetical protein
MRYKRISIFKTKSAVSILLMINVFVFFLQIILGKQFTESFMLISGDILIRPWIILTSMFLHANFFHLFVNLYALLMFGSLVERAIGKKQFFIVYFLSGLLAATIPFYDAALGASGAIMGIVGMVIILFPNLPVLLFFFIPMTMRTAGIIFAALDIFGMFTSTGSGIAHYAHLVGLATGLIYGYFYLKKYKHKFKTKPFNFKKNKNFQKDYNKIIDMNEYEIEDYLKK